MESCLTGTERIYAKASQKQLQFKPKNLRGIRKISTTKKYPFRKGISNRYCPVIYE